MGRTDTNCKVRRAEKNFFFAGAKAKPHKLHMKLRIAKYFLHGMTLFVPRQYTFCHAMEKYFPIIKRFKHGTGKYFFTYSFCILLLITV